jgi:hypothetical protein
MSIRIHRVVVRGQFADLTDEQRAALLAEADDHEIFRAAYTADGTFTYERNLVAYQFRYEVRLDDEGGGGGSPTAEAADPAEIGRARAEEQMATWGLGTKHVRATATDMSTLWSG